MPRPGKDQDPQDLQFYARVLDNVEDGVVALDQNGTISLFNPAAEACTGLSKRQSIGRDYAVLFKKQESLLALIRSALREGRSIFNYEDILLQRATSGPIPVSVSVSP